MIIDFVIPTKGEPLVEAFKRWRGWADPKVCCDYALHMAITYWDESVPAQMETVTGEGVGINSFKVFMAYKDVFMLRDNEIIEAFKVGKSFLLKTSDNALSDCEESGRHRTGPRGEW